MGVYYWMFRARKGKYDIRDMQRTDGNNCQRKRLKFSQLGWLDFSWYSFHIVVLEDLCSIGSDSLDIADMTVRGCYLPVRASSAFLGPFKNRTPRRVRRP